MTTDSGTLPCRFELPEGFRPLRIHPTTPDTLAATLERGSDPAALTRAVAGTGSVYAAVATVGAGTIALNLVLVPVPLGPPATLAAGIAADQAALHPNAEAHTVELPCGSAAAVADRRPTPTVDDLPELWLGHFSVHVPIPGEAELLIATMVTANADLTERCGRTMAAFARSIRFGEG